MAAATSPYPTPKPAPSAFWIWLCANKESVREKVGFASSDPLDLSQAAEAHWEKLPKTEKKHYIAESQARRYAWLDAMAELRDARLGISTKGRKKRRRRKKKERKLRREERKRAAARERRLSRKRKRKERRRGRPRAYCMWLSQHRQELRSCHPGLKISKIAWERWKAMPSEEKAPWTQKAREEAAESKRARRGEQVAQDAPFDCEAEVCTEGEEELDADVFGGYDVEEPAYGGVVDGEWVEEEFEEEVDEEIEEEIEIEEEEEEVVVNLELEDEPKITPKRQPAPPSLTLEPKVEITEVRQSPAPREPWPRTVSAIPASMPVPIPMNVLEPILELSKDGKSLEVVKGDRDVVFAGEIVAPGVACVGAASPAPAAAVPAATVIPDGAAAIPVPAAATVVPDVAAVLPVPPAATVVSDVDAEPGSAGG